MKSLAEPFPHGETVQLYFCAICNGPGSTKHHLVPKAVRAKRGPQSDFTIRLCQKCHVDVHYYLSNWELGYRFNTLEKLMKELETRKATKKANDSKCLFPPSDRLGIGQY